MSNRMIDTVNGSEEPIKRPPPRDTWAALKRGLRGQCPACGEGRILHGYLKVNDACPSCHEEFHHHRADDFPPYITIFVVGHVLGAAMFTVDETWPDLPMTFHFLVWPTLCILLSLWLLPIFKGGLIAYQWALRMHGFETAHPTAVQGPDVPALAHPLPHRSAA
jgi:uncharacterized protein (DUF983 family)